MKLRLFFIVLHVFCFISINAQDYDFEKAFFPVIDDDKGTVSFVNIDGKNISQHYDYDCYDFGLDWRYNKHDNILIVQKNRKYGIINHNGEIIACKYDDLIFDKYGEIIARIDDKYGIISIDGKEILPIDFTELNSYYKGFIGEKNGRYAFYNRKGQIISKEFDSMYYNENVDLLEVHNKGKGTGFIDTSGNIIIPSEYNGGYTCCMRDYFKSGFTPLEKEGELFLFNSKGKRLKIGTYKGSGGYVKNNMFIISKKVGEERRYGFANTKGEIVIPCKYESIQDFSDGLAYVKINNEEYAYVDKNGKEVIHRKNSEYTDPFYFQFGHGLAPFKSNKKWGYINKRGQVVISPIYDEARPFFEETGTAFVCKDGKWGIIDNEGNEIVGCQWRSWEIMDFHLYHCLLWNNEVKGLYDLLQKRWIIPGVYEDYDETNIPTVYRVNRGKDKYGYYDIVKKEEVISCKYSEEEACWKLVEFCQNQMVVDIEKEIPQIVQNHRNTFAVIISNEKYSEAGVADVNYARRDGDLVKEYFLKTLGLPEKNIHLRQDATLNQIRSELRWISEIAKAFGEEAKIIFYYTGHGIPDEKSGGAYLFPVDGIPTDVESSYSLADLYQQLGSLPVKQTTVFIDACFSGSQRNGNMLVSAKGVAIKAKTEAPKGNMVVLTASQGDETAYFYKKKKHGLFTYYLLKKLQDAKGNCTLGELGDYIKKEVSKYSIVENGKSQTPTISVSPTMRADWRNLKIY